MNKEQIIAHSKAAYGQWAKQWRENAHQHKGFTDGSFEDFRHSGIGKAALLVANGYSFEENIETIKKYKDNVDVIACDKTLGHLLDHGIEPYICIVCDANVSFEKYLAKWKDKLQNTILFNNVCGNPRWTKEGNWKKIYTFVNEDVLGSEKEFMAISGCKNKVTAGTNVSNMMIVLMVQANNQRNQNLFSYDKLILIGFDYSWRHDGGYYAFDYNGDGKRFYMRHSIALANGGKLIYSSNNLSASASWAKLYVENFKVPVAQCSTYGLQPFTGFCSLEKNMQYSHKPSDAVLVKTKIKRKMDIELELNKLNNEINQIAKDHFRASLASR